MNTINIKKIATTSVLALALLLMSAGSIKAVTFTQLTGQLDFGQTSSNVTNLQTFLASDPSIYPQGRVTGYFGPLTKSAVMNFQSIYGIAQVGRVGPQTLAKINSLIASGVGLARGDVNAPIIYSPSISNLSSTGAVVKWTTNELTMGRVFYSKTSFQLAEAANSFSKPTITGGSATIQSTTLQNSYSVAIQGLQANTLYNYIIESTDSAGNLSYTWPATFTTK